MATGDSYNGNENIVFVNPGSTTRNAESAENDLEGALTRVMSPSPNLVIDGLQIERWGLRGYALPCGICNKGSSRSMGV